MKAPAYTASEPFECVMTEAEKLQAAPWRWKNCRSIGLKVGIWIAPWHLAVMNSADGIGGAATVQIGPIDIEFHYSIGEAWARRLEPTNAQ